MIFARFLLIALLFSAAWPVHSATSQERGRKIYRQQCAECHGKGGQGVKGKYEDPLEGDWSLQKLTRYIERNMPEEAPEKCQGTDAEAVARYIHDEFYSREARLRKNPLRIELVHLTNRQYQNALADLFSEFIPGKETPGSDRGLRGVYYNAKGFNKEKIISEQIDPQIVFDFGDAGPKGVTTNEFAIQWRGSLLPDESGTYEFVVKTALGTRFWINNNEEPAIDAWVASGGEVLEHKISLKLIGGRAYPLRLDCFRFKDKHTSIALLWKPPHGTLQPIPARNLTPDSVKMTYVIQTPFPPDDSSSGYERGLLVSKEWDAATTQGALETAHFVSKRLDLLSNTKPGDTNRLEKVQSFCEQLVSRAFRRPLKDGEKNHYVGQRFITTDNLEDAVKQVILLALKSPQFLYLGLYSENPDQHEVATRLSFSLWDSLPDQALRQAAAGGKLSSPEEIRLQARRLLKDPRARAKMQEFLQAWLQMHRVEELEKDHEVFPEFTPELIADLRTSLNLFLNEIVWSEKSDYRELLRAETLYANDRIARFYGLDLPGTNDFVRVAFPPGERSGVLTHPYLLAAFSYAKTTSPIHRGVFLTRNIVGRALRAPPVAVSFDDSEFDPSMTMREKVTRLTEPQNCQGCHSVINPLGFSLEHFDAVGRYRTEENGKAIDALSEYLADDGTAIRLAAARDVANYAITSPHGQSAFVEQLFHKIVKQPIFAYGRDVTERLRQSFVASGFNIQELAVEIAALAAAHRPPPSERKSS